MSSAGRPRGRPIGTGLDDRLTLQKMADMIASDPSMKPTTAAKRALDAPGESTIRRLQVKWKAGGAQYLADARVKRSAAMVPKRTAAPYSPRTFRHLAEAHRKLSEAIAPRMREVHEAMNSPAMQAAQEALRRYQESPEMRAMQESIRRFEESPAVQAMREAQRRYAESPAIRAMQELQSSPTTRAIQELQSSPTMQAMRELSARLAIDNPF